jgi:adenylate cyclase
MFTDMVGYTALAQKDEANAVELLEEHRRLLGPIFQKHDGQIIDTIGDAFLVEFASALDAVRCAIEIQSFLKESNGRRADDRKIILRVGIHLGDVIHKGDDVSGDAVNVASRIEPLATPGGICLTGQVYNSVLNKVDADFESLGSPPLKNVTTPVEVFRLKGPRGDATSRPLEEDARPKSKIAVLPLANMSPDPGDEYFADGMTEELISTLSGIGGLTVISRTSAMQYKGAKKSLVDIGRELGAGTLLEGSVRKAGNRVRITLQLLDASEDKHLWAHSYDRDLDDIFAIQTEVARLVADSLAKGVFLGNLHEETPDVQAYTLYIRAKQLLRDTIQANIRESLSLFTKATELDPDFSKAYAGITEALFYLGSRGYEDFTRVVENMRLAAEKSLELGPHLAEPHYAMGIVYESQDLHAEAALEFKKAIKINPNLADAYTWLGLLVANLSGLNEALPYYEKVLELDPLSINAWLELSGCYRWIGRKAESYKLLQRVLELYPKNPATFLWGFANYYMWFEEYTKAQESIDKARYLGAEEYDIKWPQGILYALTGKREKVVELIEYYKELRSTNESAGLTGVFQLAAMLGDLDEAFRCLDRMAETGAWGPQVKFSKYLAPLRADPRYLEFCKKVRIPP